MSLLLDALKRAEQEKLARQGEASNDAAPARPASTPPAKAVAAASLELQPLSSGAPVSAPGTRGDDPTHAAKVMFDAKAPRTEEKRGRGMLWATLGAIAILVGSAGAYVWYQMRVLSPPPTPAVARRSTPPPLPQAAAGATPPAAEAITESPRMPATVTVVAEPPVPPASANLRAAAPPAPVEEDSVARMLREAPPAPAAAPLKLARTIDRPSIPADVSSGYEALRRGDMAEARRRYESALAADAGSLDARLGIATAEAKSGNRMLAVTQYRRVLEMDPRNATALAALAALAEGQSPEAVEAQLREDVARLPDSAALRFALGAQYASQRRWGEAQAAFFEAHRLDPAGADILYNLAVSLDHMEQSRLAADFYRRAVEAAQSQNTQFDPASARRRLAEISAR